VVSINRKKVAVLTDSAADLPAALIEKYEIHVIPLYLTMGEKTWRDGVDIKPNQFYELLKTSQDFPKTSQPNVSDFQQVFRKLSGEAESIAAVLVSSELSGTVASARSAKNTMPDVPIEIIDTRGVSMMEGFIVLAAARAAYEGCGLGEVADTARTMIGKTHVYFVVDTFEYLHRGGRIGAAARLLGTTLNIKPVLEIRDGIAHPAAQVRTRRKALAKVIQLLQEHISGSQEIRMAIINVAATHEATLFREQLLELFDPIEIMMTDCSPVLGAHVGPGTVGVAFYFV
jgi:DegV family protein with EDD domain